MEVLTMQLGDQILVNFDRLSVPGQLRFVLPLAEDTTAIPGRIIATDGDRARVRIFEGSPQEAESWVPADRVTARAQQPSG
jgi:hypothetical protein